MDITYNGIDLTIVGTYHPPMSGTWDEPPEYAWMEIEAIQHAGDDIMGLLTDDVIDAIEELATAEAPSAMEGL